MSKEELVKCVRYDDFRLFLKDVREKLRRKELEQNPGRLQIIAGETKSENWLIYPNGVTLLLWDQQTPDDEVLTHMYAIPYRGIFKEDVLDNSPQMTLMNQQLRLWMGRGRLEKILFLYFARSAQNEFLVAVNNLKALNQTNFGHTNDLVMKFLETREGIEREKFPALATTSIEGISTERLVSMMEAARELITQIKICLFTMTLNVLFCDSSRDGRNE